LADKDYPLTSQDAANMDKTKTLWGLPLEGVNTLENEVLL
jgi:hypothetical protein